MVILIHMITEASLDDFTSRIRYLLIRAAHSIVNRECDQSIASSLFSVVTDGLLFSDRWSAANPRWAAQPGFARISPRRRGLRPILCRSVNALTVFRVFDDEELNCYEKGLCAVALTAVNGVIWLVDKRLKKELMCVQCLTAVNAMKRAYVCAALTDASRMKKNDQWLFKTSFKKLLDPIHIEHQQADHYHVQRRISINSPYNLEHWCFLPLSLAAATDNISP